MNVGLVTAVLAASALRVPGPLAPRIASYQIEVRLDPERHTISGRETLVWRNATNAPADQLWFHLYWNAFKNETTAMMARSQLRRAPVADGKWGWTEVSELRCEGQALALELAEDGTVARTVLAHPVLPGGTVSCDIRWHAQMPALIARAGYAGDFHMVAQWFPKIGVWDGRSWKCHVYCETCEFFADFGVYDVAITAPRTFVVGASGVLESEEVRGTERVLHYHAEDLHDFAWAAAPGLLEKRASIDAVEALPPVAVRLLYPPGHAWFADRQLALVQATLRDYGDWFGRYPYSTLTVLDLPDDAAEAAMEYPTLSGTESPPSMLWPSGYARYVTIHEVGHNWFYGMVASNEAEDPWLDEGLNQYASDLVLERSGGTGIGLPVHVLERRGWLASGAGWDPFGLPAAAYPDRGAYEAAVYSQTTTFLYSLERRFGQTRLLAALGWYARRNRFRHPTPVDFVKDMSDGLGEDIAPLARQLMAGAVWDYEVARVSARRGDARAAGRWLGEVIVHRKGTLEHPVDVRVGFEDGTAAFEKWDGAARWTRFEYERSARVREATVDPENAWLLDVDFLNNGRRREATARPAARIASGVAFFFETLAQLIGF